MSFHPAKLRRSRRGFSLIEVLILVVVVGIVGAAAGRALQTVAAAPVANDRIFQIETQLISKMEYVRAQPFDSLLVASPNPTLSDTVTVGNVTYQRIVNIDLADANGDGVPDATLKMITVTCGGQSVSTLVSK